MSDENKEQKQHTAPLTLGSLPTLEQLQGMSADQVNKVLALAEAQVRLLDVRSKLREANEQVIEDAQKQSDFAGKMQVLRQFIVQREATQQHCNHRKGGSGANAVLFGEGTSPNYCVIKHKLPNGKFFVLCQRCGKEWFAADKFANGGRGTPETPGYAEALNYPTDNNPSGSSTFLFERIEA